uniref:Uncharacterized protein n=1 Tax=Arundo donax TaxID=35708 RepID=A0A0A9GJL5_ARUDO
MPTKHNSYDGLERSAALGGGERGASRQSRTTWCGGAQCSGTASVSDSYQCSGTGSDGNRDAMERRARATTTATTATRAKATAAEGLRLEAEPESWRWQLRREAERERRRPRLRRSRNGGNVRRRCASLVWAEARIPFFVPGTSRTRAPSRRSSKWGSFTECGSRPNSRSTSMAFGTLGQ